MNFTDIFVRRPVLATVINLIILLAGIQALRILNVRQYPRSDVSVVTVRTVYVGASAELVRGFITVPLERAIASADGIDYIESKSEPGLSTILVRLRLNFEPNAALTQIQTKIAQVRGELPPEAEAPTIDLETSDSQVAAAYLSFYSDALDQNQITDFLLREVQPKLTAIAGVQKAEILGGRVFAMRVWLKPDQLAAYGIAPSEVYRALSANNYLAAVGRTKGETVAINLTANTSLEIADEFRELVVRENNGVLVRLKDVADVELGAENYEEDVRFDGERATFMGIWVLPTANVLEVMTAVGAALPEIQRQLPSGMEMRLAYDSSTYIRSALREVTRTLIETLLIVVVVIFLFLGTFRTAFIPAVAIPISLIGGVFLMWAFGFTLNLLTLLAIVLAVGLVVDDAIVVVENVERHLQSGLSPVAAALRSGRELFTPIVAMTITLAAVYAPIGFQGGLTGALFREFALTLAGAVMVSGVVAITLSPMMASKLLRSGTTQRRFAAMIHRHFDLVRDRYRRILERTLEYQPVTLTLAVLVMLLIVPFFLLAGKELAPREDQGVIFGIVQAAPNATLDQTARAAEQVYQVFHRIPETEHTFQAVWPNFGFSGMTTKPWHQRTRTTDEILPEVVAGMAAIPGLQVVVTTPPALPGGGQYPVEFVVASTAPPEELLQWGEKLVQRALGSGLFVFADTNLKYDQPQMEIVFDRDQVAATGLNLAQVGLDLATYLSGQYVNRFSVQGRSYKVVPQVVRAARQTPDQLLELYVSGPPGELVQLGTFARLEAKTEPRAIHRFQQLNSVTIQGVNRPDVTLDRALRILETEAARILPRGYSVDYAGEARQLRTEGRKLNTTLFLSVILIFLVLAAQFESFRDPLIILLGSVPLAMSGALLLPFLGVTTLNIYSQIGLVTLVGLIAKNGILIVEFANKLQLQGHTKYRAIVEAASIRLRPVLMTTAATVAGHLPLVLARGPGAGARNSIGVTLVAGMAIGTVFTLLVLPAIYLLVARDRHREQGAKPPDAHDEAATLAWDVAPAK
ncbi:MAG: efflux RND transporter permease subunit [Verrucomicrobiae bacterium]|nr:efflux RND transporter permease subunit [Verrucomicrobiae bacterium]